LWLPESRALSVCQLSRSAFNSWKQAGLDLDAPGGAYGLDQVVSITILAAAREHIQPKAMVAAWQDFVGPDGEAELGRAARLLGPGDPFDLVVDPEIFTLRVTLRDADLVDALRRSSYPRPVVVVDLADRIREIVGAFNRAGNPTSKPKSRNPGRPRSANRVTQLRIQEAE